MSCIEETVMEHRRVTIRQIAETFDISYGTAQEVLSDELEMRRVGARWVPRLLTEEQIEVRVQVCQNLLDRYAKEGSNFLNKIVTCDETWVHFFEPESKQQRSVWKHPSSPPPVKARLAKSMGKVMAIIFFDIQGIVLKHLVPYKTSITEVYYSHRLRTQLR